MRPTSARSGSAFRKARVTALVALTALPLTAALIACGGGSGASEGAKSPENTGTTAPAPDPVPSTTTTTTMTLGDGGDLQGTKLSTSSTTTQTSPVGASDAGAPSPGGHEPGRSQKDIQTIILARRDEARACYDKALKDHPGIEGNIDVKWTIDPTGAVTETSVDEGKSDIHEPSVGKCIGDIIKQIRFSVSGKGLETRAHYPFNFHPRNGPQRK